MEDKSQNTEVKSNRYKGFYGPGKFKWAIYPSYWKETWGQPPLLGYVYADDEFVAVREAYSRGLCPVNYTFEPKPVKIGEAKPRDMTRSKFKSNKE